MKTKWASLILFLILCSFRLDSLAQDSTRVQPRPFQSSLKNPSIWLQQGENVIMGFESELSFGVDTAYKQNQLIRLSKDLTLIGKDFESQGAVMRIRALDDVNAKLLQMKTDVEKWRTAIRKQNDQLSTNYFIIESLKTDSIRNKIKSDSTIWSIYEPEFMALDSNIARVEAQYQSVLKR